MPLKARKGQSKETFQLQGPELGWVLALRGGFSGKKLRVQMVGQRVPRAWPAPQASLVRVPSTVTEEGHANIQWFTFSGCVSICQ